MFLESAFPKIPKEALSKSYLVDHNVLEDFVSYNSNTYAFGVFLHESKKYSFGFWFH